MDCDGCTFSLEEIDVGLGALEFMIIYERMEIKKLICVSDVR